MAAGAEQSFVGIGRKCHLEIAIRDEKQNDDDVFTIDKAKICRSEVASPSSTLPFSIGCGQAEECKPHLSDAMCQTEFPKNTSQSDFENAAVFLRIWSPRIANEGQNGTKEVKPPQRCFCWRHDAYEAVNLPARPTSLSSDFTAPNTQDHPLQILLHQGTCRICREAEGSRLNLKSRRETASRAKVSAIPSVVSIKQCPTNLLYEQFPNCSELWTENRTFYLGADPVRSTCCSINKPRGRRVRSVPTADKISKGYDWVDETAVLFDALQSRSSFCGKHSFRIGSLSLNTKGMSTSCLPNWRKQSESGHRDWLLVQRVTKRISGHQRSELGSKPHYHEFGSQEMIFCLRDFRTVSRIEDICCQHFLHISRQEALSKAKTVELLFSSHGPVVREDKHLKGRSLFYFCCHIEHTKPKQSSSSAMKVEPYHLLKSKEGKGVSDDATEVWDDFEDSTALSNATLSATNRTKTPASSKRDNALLVSFSPVLPSSPLRPFASSRLQIVRNSGPHHHLLSRHISNSRCLDGNIGKKRVTKNHSKREMNISQRKDSSSPKSKKSVKFADKTREDSDRCEKADDAQDSQSAGRSRLPPPPKLKFLEESDEEEFVRKRRESVAITFAKVPSSKKTNEVSTVPEGPSKVSVYVKKEWKTLEITVIFKDKKFSKEFSECTSLQDLYMWLRQELLQNEMLSPGAEILLTHDNLTFPLKANTANKVLSGLPTRNFNCSEILKADAGGGGFGESTSKYDTRFALPLDTRQLEGLDPVQYLDRYCIVSSTWKTFYISIFTSYDKSRARRLNYKEANAAMERIFVELAPSLFKRTIRMMGLDKYKNGNKSENTDSSVFEMDWKRNFSIGPNEFVSMCALANRILCREDEIDGFHVDTIKQKDTHLEDADFYNIEGKLRGHNVNELTKTLLLYVRNTSS